MDETRYLEYIDFDLRFYQHGNGYRAEIRGAASGTAQHAFHLPFQEHELENYLLKIGQRRSGMRKIDSPENRAARDFGNKLFETVFQGDVQSAFRQSVEAARTSDRGLRIRLHLGDTPELADLPWEYLYLPQRREFLALSTETPIVRYFDLAETVKPLAVTPPLRVLVMLSNPSDVDCLDVEKEWQKLKEAVGYLEERKLLIVERMEHATLSELQRRLRREEYHIFHFVGHGSFDPMTEESVLALEDEDGRKRLVSGSELGIYLRDERALRLVLLNACEGARASRSDPFSGAAQSLVLKGIPAVIAMQFEVSDEAAIAMASGFYAALADDYPVDAALTEARKSVFAADCAVEWGTPVLYLRSPDGRIFDVKRSESQKADPALRTPDVPKAVPPPVPSEVSDRPQRVDRSEPVVNPEPVAKADVVVSRGRETRGTRRWVWVAVGMVIMFAGFLGLGAYINWHRGPANAGNSDLTNTQPAYSPVASFTPPEVPSKFQPEAAPPANMVKKDAQAPANSNNAADLKAEIQALGKLQQEQSTKLDALDTQARKAIAGIRSDDSTPPSNAPATESYQKQPGQSGGAAGTSFRLVGTWGVVASPPYSVSRVQFQPNGRFAGQTTDGNGITQQVSGTVAYNPTTSMLSVNYDNGSWFQSRIQKWGVGFYTTFSFDGSQVEMYLEPENKSGY